MIAFLKKKKEDYSCKSNLEDALAFFFKYFR